MQLFSSTGRKITNELTKSGHDECRKENIKYKVDGMGECLFPLCLGALGYL